jgi:hypothetical protein
VSVEYALVRNHDDDDESTSLDSITAPYEVSLHRIHGGKHIVGDLERSCQSAQMLQQQVRVLEFDVLFPFIR